MSHLVSVALPVYNAQDFLEQCFESILQQTLECNRSLEGGDDKKQGKGGTKINFQIEVSVYDDGSMDESPKIIEKWKEKFESTPEFSFCLSRNSSGSPKGVGYARNQTICQSRGEYICFCDADDLMESTRVSEQLSLSMAHPDAIIGSRFRRLPEDSTRIFTTWANSMTQAQLSSQIYLSFGPSLVMPTWFCHRSTYERIHGGFDETGKGTPEDLIFFYKHLDLGGTLVRAETELVIYRYHSNATTFSITDEVIWNTRLERLETNVLTNWNQFSIWNAGKLGRRFYRSLRKDSRNKVSCFCDVDAKKISQKWYHPYPIKAKVPIVHVKDAPPPLVICVKTELTWDPQGSFRKLLDSLNLEEGVDFFYFN